MGINVKCIQQGDFANLWYIVMVSAILIKTGGQLLHFFCQSLNFILCKGVFGFWECKWEQHNNVFSVRF
jgi:hypothetical protein